MKLDSFSYSDADFDAAQAEQANRYLADPAAAVGLMARLVSAAPAVHAGPALARVHGLVHHELAELAASSGAPGASIARDLAALAKSVDELVRLPDLGNKVVVGIGGSFSAGKSRFLNTLLGVDLLPEGLEPTTAVPTCLMRGDAAICALNSAHCRVPLDREALLALAHGFSQRYRAAADEPIGLAGLVKLLTIQEPSLPWQHLALLDTPGHSRVDASASLTDEAIAREHLSRADNLVWLLSARNGALRQDDIRFLRSITPKQPVFFVLTQVDLQSNSSIAGILESVERDAAAAGISSAGVMAWSAPPGTLEGQHEGGSDIRDWLDGLNLQPKLTDKRRSAARLLAQLADRLRADNAAGREELSVLNAFWAAASELPDETASGLRQLIAGRRHLQRQGTAALERLDRLGRELDDALADVLDALGLADARSEEAVEQRYQDAFMALRMRTAPEREAHVFASLLDAAWHGHPQAQFTAAECYRLGTGTATDLRLAAAWCLRAAQQGVMQAQYTLANCYLDGVGVARSVPSALQWYEAAASQDHLQAQMKLYECHSGMLDEHVDLALAVAWLKRAANQDCAQAQYELGNCYMDGIGVAPNRRTASNWFMRAADQGHAVAQCAVGRVLLAKSGGPDDDAAAVDWLRRAAVQEQPEAQVQLGWCYLGGRGVARHRGHALSWFRKAHELGYLPGTTGVAHYYMASDDPVSAVPYFREAAQEGDAEAMYWLGACYLKGEGVRKNSSQAIHWLLRAEEEGYADATALLADIA